MNHTVSNVTSILHASANVGVVVVVMFPVISTIWIPPVTTHFYYRVSLCTDEYSSSMGLRFSSHIPSIVL